MAVILACNQSVDKKYSTDQPTHKKPKLKTDVLSEVLTSDYQVFTIKKGQLGDNKIGMNISEAEQKFKGFKKEVGQATSFAYGGGSPAYLYYDHNILAFGIIPKLNSDTILLIIAVSPQLRTINGLNPNSTVKQISEKYPNVKVNQDLMNGWEYISDTVNNWEFIFMTDEKTVGDYPELEFPSALKNKDIKADWITIQ